MMSASNDCEVSSVCDAIVALDSLNSFKFRNPSKSTTSSSSSNCSDVPEYTYLIADSRFYCSAIVKLLLLLIKNYIVNEWVPSFIIS